MRQVTQLMLGLMVMSYSIPLHLTEVTEVVRLLVPWWSGLAVLKYNKAISENPVYMFWCFLIEFQWVISIVVVCLSASPSFSQLEYLGSSWTNTAIWRWWVGTDKKLPMNSITQHQLNTLFLILWFLLMSSVWRNETFVHIYLVSNILFGFLVV